MRVERSFRWPPEGTHRFFPDWADLPARGGPQSEWDWNSYLAGGYAEEFGYHLQPGFWTGFVILARPPERSKQLRAQVGALHPGFPECPTPVDRDDHATLGGDALDEPHPISGPAPSQSRRPEASRAQFKVIVVGREGSAKSRSRLAPALMALWTDFRIRRRALGRLF